MEKVLIIVNGYSDNPNNAYKAKRLVEEFNHHMIQADIVSALDLVPYVNGTDIRIDGIEDYALAIDLDKDSYLADCIEMLRIPLCNSAKSLHLSDDKMTSIIYLKGKGIPCPLTIPSPLCYIKEPEEKRIRFFLSKVTAGLSFPLVYKANHGSMGKQVKLIHDGDELYRTEKENLGIPHLYEEFLKRNQGHDYRIMVIGKEVVACMERINDKDFRSNIALGGYGVDVTETLDQEFKELAIKATEALSLDYAGIDVAISDDGKPMFLEANGNAFFTEIEKVTGINITGKLVDYLIGKYHL